MSLAQPAWIVEEAFCKTADEQGEEVQTPVIQLLTAGTIEPLAVATEIRPRKSVQVAKGVDINPSAAVSQDELRLPNKDWAITLPNVTMVQQKRVMNRDMVNRLESELVVKQTIE